MLLNNSATPRSIPKRDNGGRRASISYPDGTVFEGRVNKLGDNEGEGAMRYKSGNKYEGEWEEGEYHGHGTKTYVDGSKHTGFWVEGKRDGPGTTTLKDGERHSGKFKNNDFSDVCHIKLTGNPIKLRAPRCVRPSLYGEHVFGVDTYRFHANEPWIPERLRSLTGESTLQTLWLDREAKQKERLRIGRHFDALHAQGMKNSAFHFEDTEM